MDRIVSCYLTGKPDPQRDEFVEPDDWEYCRVWAESALALDLPVTILHDGLSPEFRAAHPEVEFEKVALPIPGWTLLDDRWFCCHDYLVYHPEVNRVFFTDISDVRFERNPFRLILRNSIYIGSEPWIVKDNKWICGQMTEFWGEVFCADRPLFNGGILGGRRGMLSLFLDYLIGLIVSKGGSEMAAIQYVVNRFDDAGIPVSTGHPLHSRFKAFESNTGAAIYHK